MLLSIVEKFKNTVENKKTDAVTWREKDTAWERISEIFNSKYSEVFKTKNSLRKLYENLKKNVRKQFADEKKIIICTGGGPPLEKKPKGETEIKDQILSLVNRKTIYGLQNSYDGDAVTEKQCEPECSKNIYSLSDEEFLGLDEHNYCSVANEVQIDTNEVTIMNTPKQEVENKSTKNTNILKRKKDDTLNVDVTWSSRRKPQMKDTSAFDLKKEYSSLAQVKFELYSEELKLAKNRNKREEELYQLNRECLALEIEKKKWEIKRLQRYD